MTSGIACSGRLCDNCQASCPTPFCGLVLDFILRLPPLVYPGSRGTLPEGGCLFCSVFYFILFPFLEQSLWPRREDALERPGSLARGEWITVIALQH